MTITQYLNTFQKTLPAHVDMVNILDDYIYEKEKNKGDIKYLLQFQKYLKHEYGFIYTDEISEDLFKRFILYHIPKTASFLTYNKSKQLLKELGFFMASERVKSHKNIKRDYNNVYYEYLEEFPRIMQLQKEIKNEIGYPVVEFDPLVVDLLSYRREKLLDKYQEKSPIMEQGFFQVLEVFGSGIVIFKKLFGSEMYIKLHIGRNIVPYLKKYDIIHMRISRRLFFTTWNLDSVKSCYHKDALSFLKA